MIGVFTGFGVIVVVIGVGWLLAASGILPDGTDRTLSLVTFFVATPALLFTTLVAADLGVVFSSELVVAAVSALAAGVVYAMIARFALRRPGPDALIGALSSSYVNSANLGIPVAVHVLGDLTVVAPLLLFQVVAYGPGALAALDVMTGTSGPRGAAWRRPLANPLVLAACIGLALAVGEVHPPAAVMAPVEVLAAGAVPLALLAFGISLHGRRVLDAGVTPRRDVALVTVVKVLVQPAIAWFIGAAVLGLEGQALLVVLVLAALPTAQNVFTYAMRYQRGVTLARDAGVVTTLAAAPVIALIAAFFG